jgi:DNA-binding Lrp family transcriptional regulator
MRSASSYEAQFIDKTPTPAELFYSNNNVITENLKEGFTQIPNWILKAPIPCIAKLVYIYLLCRCRQGDRCWPSIQRIADDLGSSRRTVIRMVKLLLELGFIEKVRRGLNKTNLYYINLIEFPASFRHPSRTQSMIVDSHDPDLLACLQDTPLREVSLFYPEQKCQNSASRDDKETLLEVPNCHLEEYEKTNHTQSEEDADESKIRGGFAALKRGNGRRASSCSQGELEAIGIVESPSYVEIQKKDEIEEPFRKDQSGDNIENSNTSRTPEEMPRADRAKELKENKTGTTRARTFEDMATLAGITSEALQNMNDWLKAHQRPEIIPLKLQGIIPAWSRELGNSEPHLIAANLTQASKLYMYARKNGLSQPETESCFEHAREVIHKRPEVRKKMAFLFSTLKLDILVALKQRGDLQASQPSILSSIPDGYDEEIPTYTPPATTRRASAPACPTTPPEPEPKATTATIEVITIPADGPRPEWKTWETASWWGERLRDELDPRRTFSHYDVRPTEGGCYGFELSLSPQADPIWKELVAGGYVTCAMVQQSLETIQTVRQSLHASQGTRANRHQHTNEANPTPRRHTNTTQQHMQDTNGRYMPTP